MEAPGKGWELSESVTLPERENCAIAKPGKSRRIASARKKLDIKNKNEIDKTYRHARGLRPAFLNKFYHVFPSPALPGSGSMGIISARYIKAPLNCCKGTAYFFKSK